MRYSHQLLFTGALLLCTLTGCLVEDKKEKEKTEAGDYVIAMTSHGDDATDYFMTASSLTEDTLSALGRGIEQTGWRYCGTSFGNYFSAGYFTDNNFISYTLDASGELAEKGRFTFQTTLDLFGEVSEHELLSMEIPREGYNDRVFHRISLDDISITAKVSTPIYENRTDSMTAQPTALAYRDGKVFVPFYHLHANGTFSTPNTDTAFVAVYSYPALTLDKIIKDTRSGPFGIYGNSNGLIKTESDDIYGYSCASRACFNSDSTPMHSKILRIKKGETEFDPDYEFDFQEATGGRKLTWFAPIGGELAIGRAMESPIEAAGGVDTTIDWVGLFRDYQELYIIDLANKTASKVAGVPVHGGQYGTPWFVEDGKVYLSIVTETPAAADIYAIDIAGKTGTKGAAIKGKEVKLMARGK